MSEREGDLVYDLMHHGWRKGVEIFRNRWTAHFHFDKSVPEEEREQIIEAARAGLDGIGRVETINVTGVTDSPSCDRCGYTEEDQHIHGDHHLCPGTIPPTLRLPWRIDESGNTLFEWAIVAADGGSVCHMTRWTGNKEVAERIIEAVKSYSGVPGHQEEREAREKVEAMFENLLDSMGAMGNPSEIDAMALGISPDEAEEIRDWIRERVGERKR